MGTLGNTEVYNHDHEDNDPEEYLHGVNFSIQRGFKAKLKASLKEALFPDDPFRQFKNEEKRTRRVLKGVQYFIPIFEWLPTYNWRLFCSDLIAGLTISSLAIPQGISYAKLADLPPLIGLYSSFVPPLVYAIFGSSRHMAVGTIAAASLLIGQTIQTVADPNEDPTLYLHLIFTTTFVTGVFQAALGFFRLGILVDFFSHSTINGFMGGTAVILILQQLKGVFGMIHFSQKTNLVAVVKSIVNNRHEIRWEPTVLGVVLLAFLQFTKHLRNKKPKLFWVQAIGPMVTVVVAGVFTYLVKGQKHGIQIVGHLDKGLNPLSIHYLNFNGKYLSAVLQAGIITGVLSLAEGIAIGRSFAVTDNTPHDGNKEMIAFGLMNLFGSFTSCYLTSGPFSKTAVNYNAGCKTAMANVIQAVIMALTLQFLAPLFGYTPLVALSVIIISAMLGLIHYEEVVHLFKVDKFDFVICMAAFLGVILISMDVGLMISVGLGVLRALLYVARPAPCKLGKLAEVGLYRDTEQYKVSTFAGVLIIQLGSPVYFANSNYVKERIMRYIRSEQASTGENVEHIVLDLSGVTSIDTTAIKALDEMVKVLTKNAIKILFVNPRVEVLEKLMLSKFVDKIGRKRSINIG
ncbi:probable sulfate transporter 3.5 isoform X2 [Vigna umbellata]|uniref:probable sulfate transporter 3.5 isoform X1 n=1 Tax=Vigna umbellata TaxID=87088 RepID=UPI001F5ED0F8|nr:probable sulfate transporter 3.5 isoform X1 [Vigna umbellata]XP_047171317.1 probable sulfate transporter 3.5 isoform X2 [Vigna umbellata]